MQMIKVLIFLNLLGLDLASNNALSPCVSQKGNASIYTGVINPEEAYGASGYFSLSIAGDGSYSNYTVFLDLSQFTTSCDLRKGLMFHLHSYWDHSKNITSASNQECLIDSIGGHYGIHTSCISAKSYSVHLQILSWHAAIGVTTINYTTDASP